MRKLERTVAAPICLAQYRHGTHNWGHVTPEHKEQIWIQLECVQGQLCAYCEGSLDMFGKHIEHFRRKSLHPKLTFDWSNLYGSCDQDDCCGQHKDKDGWPYDVTALIDPCHDDPDRFYRFRSNGTIGVREGLSQNDQFRATETLRVFNLDPEHGRLRSLRQRTVETYQAVEPGILEALVELPEAERLAFIKEEIERTASEQFSTVIRHLFEDLL